MAQPPQTRNLLAIVLRNFINSLRPRQIMGNLKGTDHFGTKYYEIPANLSRGKQKRSRWFVPLDKEDFEQEMPAEWEAWLRGRRIDPPEEEEVLRNLEIMQIKKKNAIEVEKKAGKMTPALRGMETFPKRPDFEIKAGTPQKK